MEVPGKKREKRGRERGRAAEKEGRKEKGKGKDEDVRICPLEDMKIFQRYPAPKNGAGVFLCRMGSPPSYPPYPHSFTQKLSTLSTALSTTVEEKQGGGCGKGSKKLHSFPGGCGVFHQSKRTLAAKTRFSEPSSFLRWLSIWKRLPSKISQFMSRVSPSRASAR